MLARVTVVTTLLKKLNYYIYYILNFQFSATCNIPLHSGRNSSYSLYCCLLMYDFLDNSDRQSVCIVERGH